MEEGLPLHHNHLVLTSLMTQSPNCTLYGRYNTGYKTSEISVAVKQPGIELAVSQLNASFPKSELKMQIWIFPKQVLL